MRRVLPRLIFLILLLALAAVGTRGVAQAPADDDTPVPPDLPVDSLKKPPKGPGIAVPENGTPADKPAAPAKRKPAVEAGAAGAQAGLAAKVKAIFKDRCFECHGDKKVKGKVKILDHQGLLKQAKILPGKPDDSPLYKLVASKDEDDRMPPKEKNPLTPQEVEIIKQWLQTGAEAFPEGEVASVAPDAGKVPMPVARPDVPIPSPGGGKAEPPPPPVTVDRKFVGPDYIQRSILDYVRKVRFEDKAFVRFFSLNHLLGGKVSGPELEQHRAAFVVALNSLSWENRFARVEPIDEARTLFAVDIRELGWHKPALDRVGNSQSSDRAALTLFDLILFEYPYGIMYPDSEAAERLVQEFVKPSGMCRPVAYLRADWLIAAATQGPLYYDLLQLPPKIDDLEATLGVSAQEDIDSFRARRSGLVESRVAPHNRVVERHPAKYGAYWKTYDFLTSKGGDNIDKSPGNLRPDAFAALFTLPNGLQGYYLADAAGRRINAISPQVLPDRLADDYTNRAGLSCIRCHDRGVQPFVDSTRPALKVEGEYPGLDRRQLLQLYAEQPEVDGLVKEDTGRFLAAVARLFAPSPDAPPTARLFENPPASPGVVPATKRYLDAPVPLELAAPEVGSPDPAQIREAFRAPTLGKQGLAPLAAGGSLRRDSWEDVFDQAVRGLGTGLPVANLDAVTRRDYQPEEALLGFSLKSGERGGDYDSSGSYQPYLCITNKSGRPLYVEVIRVSTSGTKAIIVPATTVIRSGGEHQCAVKISKGSGRDQLVVFACESEFPGGELYRSRSGVDRVVHPFYELQRSAKGFELAFDPARVVKKTVTLPGS